jgi:hypothetical protein
MILRNGTDHLRLIRHMPPAGDLFLVAEDALEWAPELRDEDRDGIVLQIICIFTKIVMRVKLQGKNH